MVYCRAGKNFFNENRTCWIEMDTGTPIRDLDGAIRTPREVAQRWGITKFPAFVVILCGHHPAAAHIGISTNLRALLHDNPTLVTEHRRKLTFPASL